MGQGGFPETSKPVEIVSGNATSQFSVPKYIKSPKNRSDIIITDNNITVKTRKDRVTPYVKVGCLYVDENSE